MILIIGGAYQGKLNYAFENYGQSLSVFSCSESETAIDFTKNVINSFQLLVLAHVKNGIDTCSFITKNIENFNDKIIICDEIGGGIVPVEKEERLWREAVGRCCGLLATHADEVVRVFCGLGMRLK